MFKNKKEQSKHWNGYGKRHLVGRKIESVRWLSEEECEGMGWHSRPIALHLDDGTIIFPSKDDEGNNGGALFGQGPGGEKLTFPVNGG
jgi:hypothetical protein